MKKFWIIGAAAVLTISLSACGVGDVGGVSSNSPAPSSAPSAAASSSPALQVTQDSVDDSLAGLQKYLVGNASVTGTPTTMRADMIGAKSGVRYQYGFSGGKNNVTLELYEYDTSALNDTAKKILSDVKSSGKFTLMTNQVNGMLSDSGKYLMIYKNTANDDANKAYGAQVRKLFTEFKN